MRSYGEVIDVRTARPSAGIDADVDVRPAGAPEQFLWRGRIYLVRDVLAHWVELGAWWVAPGRPATRPGSAAGEGARSVAADVGAVEREVWRVEAAPGRSAAAGVYDLVRDVPAVAPAGRASDGTAYDHEPDDPGAPGMSPGGHRPDAPQRWRLARALD